MDGIVTAQQGHKTVKVNDEAGFLLDAQERAKTAVDAWSENHRKWREDADFLSGKGQWEERVRVQREKDERVILTINQLPKFVRQVLGDGKQNRIQIKVRPVEADRGVKFANVAGTRDYSFAQVMEGLVRNIETVSRAEVAYDRALAHCVQGGFGWLRVIKRHARPDGFEQELAIRSVHNPFAVLYDSEAMISDEPDFTGANFAFVQTVLPKKVAQKKYGKDIADTEISDSLSEAQRWWYSSDGVRFAEYFYVEEQNTLYALLSDGSVMEAADLEAAKHQVAQRQLEILDDRKGVKRCVYWALLGGRSIVEGPYKWDGGYIPLVPVLGPELWLENGVEYESLIRHSHDAQRMYNYWRTAATEAVALAPKAPWQADVASIQGFEKDYQRSTREPVALLKYRAREGVPPPARVQTSADAAAEIQQAMHANDDVKGTLGLFDASIGARSNETSGKAIAMRQREGDVGTFSWHDALSKAAEHIGRIIVDAAPRIYDTDRIVRLRFPDESEDFVRINYDVSGPDGQPVKADLRAQRCDVAVVTGPSMTTQRLEAADSMMSFVQAIPDAGKAIMDVVAKNMDWPGSDDIAKRLKKMLPPELLEPAERAQMQEEQGPPDPQAEAAAQAQAQAAAAQMQAQQNEAQAKLIAAQARLITAQAKLAEAQAMNPEKIKDLVAEAVAEVLASMRSETPPQSAAA